MREGRFEGGGRRPRAAALLAILCLAAACDEPAAPRGGGGAPSAEPGAAPGPPAEVARELAFVRDGSVVVASLGGAGERVVYAGGAGAFAWGAGGRTLYVAEGMTILAVGAEGGEPRPVATLRDEANAAISRLEAAVAGRSLVAETAGEPGPEQFADSRYFEVDAATGAARELSARAADALSGRPRRYTSARDEPLVSPSGRRRLRVAGLEAAGSRASGSGRSTERILVAEAGSGPERAVADVASLPAEAGPSEGAGYTGQFNDVAWAPDSATLLFVAQEECGDVCRGPLFAVGADGTGLRRLGASLESVPREWNGPLLLFDDAAGAGRVVVVYDAAAGERRELGPGRSPKWAPGRAR